MAQDNFKGLVTFLKDKTSYRTDISEIKSTSIVTLVHNYQKLLKYLPDECLAYTLILTALGSSSMRYLGCMLCLHFLFLDLCRIHMQEHFSSWAIKSVSSVAGLVLLHIQATAVNICSKL